MDYADWLVHREDHRTMMLGDRPTCKQCGERLQPHYRTIDLEPTEEEIREFAINKTSKDFKEWGAEQCEEYGEDPKQWFKERIENNMHPATVYLWTANKPDYSQEPRNWGYNSNNNFCTLRCGIDYADDAVEAKARGRAKVLQLVSQK